MEVLSTSWLLVTCLSGQVLVLLHLQCLQDRVLCASHSADSAVFGRIWRTCLFNFRDLFGSYFVHVDVQHRCELLIRTIWCFDVYNTTVGIVLAIAPLRFYTVSYLLQRQIVAM